MDKKLVASKQAYELHYISYKFHIPMADVKTAVKEAGRSRKKVYAALREMGYEIKTKSFQ